MDYSKHLRKIIYKGKDRNVACIVSGYYPSNLKYFNVMYKEAKKDYPYLTIGEVLCGKIRDHHNMDGFTIIVFTVEKIVDTWSVINSGLDFYF